VTEPLSPLEVAAIKILVSNAASQLNTLMMAMVTPEQYDALPRLRTNALNAAKMARTALGNFIKRIEEARR